MQDTHSSLQLARVQARSASSSASVGAVLRLQMPFVADVQVHPDGHCVALVPRVPNHSLQLCPHRHFRLVYDVVSLVSFLRPPEPAGVTR